MNGLGWLPDDMEGGQRLPTGWSWHHTPRGPWRLTPPPFIAVPDLVREATVRLNEQLAEQDQTLRRRFGAPLMAAEPPATPAWVPSGRRRWPARLAGWLRRRWP
jgi:hypothetical protein